MSLATDIANGILILDEYCSSKENHVHTEHDSITAGPDDSRNVSEEDAKKLIDMGWFQDDDGYEFLQWMIYTI